MLSEFRLLLVNERLRTTDTHTLHSQDRGMLRKQCLTQGLATEI